MKNIFICCTLTVLLFGCSTNTGSPKATVTAFIETLKKGDIQGLKKLITKSDVSLLEFAEKMGNTFGQGKNIQEEMRKKFMDQSKNVSFDVKDEKIEGDNATVNVAITQDAKTTTQPFKLIKEDGSWKVALTSTGMNMAGKDGDMNNSNINIADSLKKGMQQLQNMSTDSLQKLLNEGMEKLKEVQKKNPDVIKNMEEALKKMEQKQ